VTLVTEATASNVFWGGKIAEASGMQLYDFTELRFTAPYFSTMKCFLNGEKAVYCSSEVSSGCRMYEALRTCKVNSSWDLEKNFADVYKKVRQANGRAAKSFARSVQNLQPVGTVVINPEPLKIPEWDQPEYLAFWVECIRHHAKEVRFNKNWEFSNGCTLEFAAALSTKGITTLDHEGKELTLEAAIRAIEKAIETLPDFDTTKLHKNLERLRSLMTPTPTVIGVGKLV
jgi:hypothetical protein